MGRKKEREIKIKSYALDVETIKLIDELSEFEGMKKSEFLSFLVENWSKGIDPNEQMVDLLQKREKLQIEIEKIDKLIKKQSEYIKYNAELQKQKSEKKKQAINIIKSRLLNRDFEEAQRLSKVWCRMTGIPAMELIIEADKQLKNEGI